MSNMNEIIDWADEYTALLNTDFPGTVPLERTILENSREMLLNNAAGHLALIAPLPFIYSLPQSETYFFRQTVPWWMG
jgi:hypothetical protein